MITIETLRKVPTKFHVEIFVAGAPTACGGCGENDTRAPRPPPLLEHKDAMVLHARHPSDVFFTDTGQYVKGAGIRSGQICFLLELPATSDRIDPDRVFLEEFGRGEKRLEELNWSALHLIFIKYDEDA